MSQYRDLVVRIVGDAKGMKKATSEAESGLAAFEDRVGKLGSALAGAFAGGAILAFAKQTVDAALEDQRAQERLAKTLENVTNATRAQIAAVEDYISLTESQYAVMDDELRPAFETLVRATKDTAQAQSLLQLALDVSAGSGKSLQDVSVALVKAMGGQMRGLKDLGIQVKTTSGDTASFVDVQAQLNAMFGGQAAEAANSQTGQMKALQIQYENTKEAIGRALLPVMLQLANVAEMLFGWFNGLSSGTQQFIVQLVAFGAIAFGAVKAFTAIQAAIALTGTTLTAALPQLTLFAGVVAGMAFLASKLGAGSKEVAVTSRDAQRAMVNLGLGVEDTTKVMEAFYFVNRKAAMTGENWQTIVAVVNNLGLSAEATAQLLANLGDPNRNVTDGMDRFGDKAMNAANALDDLIGAAIDYPPAIENTNKALFETGDAVAEVEKPLIKANAQLREWVRKQNISAQESERWAARTIAAYGDTFAYLEGLVNKDQALENISSKLQEYREQVEKTGDKSKESLKAQNEYALALANGAAVAAASVPGFDKLTEAQQAVAKSRFINEWARNVQKTVEPGSPLWIALQRIIDQVFLLTGGSMSSDMIGSINFEGVKLPRRAKGGPVMAGSAYVVGERGPEVFVPGASGTIIPNGAGGGNITVNVTAPTGTDPYAFGNAVVSALKSWVRVNGRLAGVAA